MAMYLVRKKVSNSGAVGVLNGSDSAIVVAANAGAARIVAGTGQPGGPAAWADADAEVFSEANLVENDNCMRFASTSDTPRPWLTE